MLQNNFWNITTEKKVTFVDEDKLNYDVWNLKVVKNKKSKTIDQSIFVDNEYSLNEFRDDLKKNKNMTFAQFKQKLQQCVSVLPNGFAVKLR